MRVGWSGNRRLRRQLLQRSFCVPSFLQCSDRCQRLPPSLLRMRLVLSSLPGPASLLVSLTLLNLAQCVPSHVDGLMSLGAEIRTSMWRSLSADPTHGEAPSPLPSPPATPDLPSAIPLLPLSLALPLAPPSVPATSSSLSESEIFKLC